MRILLMADIHIGSIKDTSYVYNVMTNIIDNEIIFKKTDAVIILGDYFDKLFRVNEEYVSLSINIMSYLVRACKRSKTKIRLIYGTESHEMNQYKLFNYHMNSSNVDLKLITTVTEEELFKDINILYVPEEYMYDKKEFYKSTIYSGKKYKYIFGHGIIAEGMPSIITFNSGAKSNEKKVPIFKSNELSSISDICVFGHYHTYISMEDNVYYLGSLFRASFGEEEPKGYSIIEDDKFTFIENKQAYVYKTYEFDQSSNIYNSSDDIISEIEKIKRENEDIFNGNNNGKIRIKLNIPENIDPSFKENIKNLLLMDKNISTLLKESHDEINEELTSEEDEYDFILDNSLDPIDKIHRFINKRYGDDISIKHIKSYINNPFEI